MTRPRFVTMKLNGVACVLDLDAACVAPCSNGIEAEEIREKLESDASLNLLTWWNLEATSLVGKPWPER